MAAAGRAAELKTLRGFSPAVALGAQPVNSLPDQTRLDLAMSLPLRNKQALAALLQSLYDPASPIFHQYLTPAAFAERFSPSEQDYQALIDFARANHLMITRLHPNRTLLDVNVTVADIRRVFRVNMKVYAHPTENRTFYAPDGAPSIRADLPVQAIKGLDNFITPRSDVKTRPIESPSAPRPLAGSGPGGAYIGNDFRTAYAPSVTLTGSGQTVALVEFDGYYPADIAKYESQAHLPAIPLTNVLVNGYSGLAGPNNLEVALDIEMLVAMAPGLSGILVYEEQLFQPVDDELNRIATDDLAAQISCSWNFFNMDAVTDQILQQYSAQGQSFFCASGDSGGSVSGQVNMPAGDPYVTVVGGTVLSTTGTNGPWQAETAWNNSSGGFTTNYDIPAWQAVVSMASNHGSTSFRNVPDVAMCADNVFIIYHYGSNETSYGAMGTSCAAPLWAGFTALVNQQAALSGNGPVGFLNPALYAIGASAGYATNFHDITTGNNTNANSPTNYFAVPGYDLCTGWGTPKGSNLINTLAPPDTLVMLPIPGFTSTGPAGGPFTVTTESYLLTNEGSVSLNWSLQTDALWLSAASTNGTLSPGATTNVAVNLNAAASNLFVGNHAAHLTLTNLGNGLLHHRSFTLLISDPLAVSPAAGFEFAGPPSGPFNAAVETCVLTNAAQVAVTWSVAANPAWLDVSPTNGVVAPDGTAQVACSLNAAATNLPAGAYSMGVVFSNNTFAAKETLPTVFLIGQLVQNGGFETGDFTDWTLGGDTNGTFVDTDDPTVVHSGAYGVYLETVGDLAYLTQAIPTIGGASYSISLWLDSPDGLTPNEFSVSWGGNTLCDYTNIPAIGWTNLQFTVLATNANTVLDIGSRDDNSYLGLDDISVTAAPPTLSSVSPASGPAAGGTTVAISGSGFQTHATVAFGSLAAASVVFNATSNLAAVTPPGAVGPVNVAITNADGQLAVLTNGFIFVGTPVITWSNPAAVPYGASLGPGQLDATANVPGSFVFNPPAGTILAAGTNTLSAVFTPNDAADYYTVTNFVTLIVLAPVPPAFQTIAQNGTNVAFSWSAAPGVAYQVQFASSLASTNWTDFGALITATNATLATNDSITGAQRFYRVLLVPQ
jgi:hypothetical protein